MRGLLVQVTPSGKKTFYVRRKVGHNSQRLFIGPYPDVSIEAARKKAVEICAVVAKGEDPQESKRRARKELTFGDLLEEYLKGHVRPRCLAAQEIEAVYRRYLSDWKHRKLSSIKKSEVQARFNFIGKTNGLTAANHTLTYARAAVNWCQKNGLTSAENPWCHVKKFKTPSRERFIKPDEFEKFFIALKKLPNEGARDYIYLSLFTGARQANVLAMKWDEIDFTLGTWRIPRTKNGDSQTLPLTRLALEVLIHRHEEAEEDAEWVFPGNGSTGHLVEPKRQWQLLLESASLADLRMHDLRRTAGSYMAMGNQSLHIIGKVLGHKSPTATQIYSKLTNDPIRAAMEQAQADMLIAAKLMPAKNNVRTLRKNSKRS
jgi:integrase